MGGGGLTNADPKSPLGMAAKAHNKSVAQIALRFIAQNGVAAIPKVLCESLFKEKYMSFLST